MTPLPAPEVVTLGECLVSLIARERGPLAESDTFLRTVAGAEANVAVGLARLGHARRLRGARRRRCASGRAIRRRLRGEGVDVATWLVDDPGAPTGLMVRELRDLGPMEVIYHRAGSAGSRLRAGGRRGGAARPSTARAWLHLTGITPALSPAPRPPWSRAKELRAARA